MKKLYVAVATIVLGVVGLYVASRSASSETLAFVTFSKDGERVCSTDNTSCRYLEYTKDETFQNVDEWLFMKFNSSDVHRIISKDIVCDKVFVAGIRVPFLSMYRNIVSVEGCN